MSTQEPTLSEVVKNRYSARAFLPSPIPSDILKDILLEAQCAPSNCNTQPWSLHIVAGDKLRELSHALTEDLRAGNYSLDLRLIKKLIPSHSGNGLRSRGARTIRHWALRGGIT